MSSLNRETKFLLSTVLPTFERVCKHTVACDNNLTVSHLTVVRLSSDGFGHIFRYCPEDVLSDHALESQESDIAVDVELRNRVFDAIPPAELQKFEGRHILLGSIPEWNRTLEYPMSLRVEPVRVALNVRWYIMADQPPLSVPMMGWVKNGQIHVPISQAITQEMFSDFNPWYVPPPMPRITPWKPRAVEVWSSASGQWEEPRTPGMLCILLPFNKVPLLRFKAVHPYRWQRLPEQASRGYLLPGLPSMKAQLYDVPYVWPEKLTFSTFTFRSVWKLSPGQPAASIKSWGADGPGAGESVRQDGSNDDLNMAVARRSAAA